MALSRFPAAFDNVTQGIITAAETARTIRDGVGPLRWSTVQQLVRVLGQLESNYEFAKVEAQKQLTAAQAYIADVGGPATLAEFNTLMTAVSGRKQNLLNGLDTLLGNLSGTDFYKQSSLNIGGYNITLLEQNDFVPDATSTDIRTSNLIANLIADLEALGA